MKYILILAFFISGCATHYTERYEDIDIQNKTVTVLPGSRGLKGSLKKALSRNGWELVVYRGPSVTEGKLGTDTRIEHYGTFKSKYRLIVSSRQYDLCFNFTPKLNYEISFINNHSGSEAFTIHGSGCESEIVDNFIKELNYL